MNLTVEELHRLAGLVFYSNNARHLEIYNKVSSLCTSILEHLEGGGLEVRLVKPNTSDKYMVMYISTSCYSTSTSDYPHDNVKRFAKLLRQLCFQRGITMYVNNTDFDTYDVIFRLRVS